MYEIEEYHRPDRIIVPNFLPSSALADLFDEIATLEPHFDQPHWSKGYETALCKGTDLWLPAAGVDAPWLANEFPQYLFHMGLRTYLEHASSEHFMDIPRMAINGKMHMVNYRDGDYYNWHADNEVRFGPEDVKLAHSTMNLTVCRNPDAGFEGGDLLLRHGKDFQRIPFRHNQIVIFASHTYHAVSEIRMLPDAEFMDGRFSVQFWLAAGDLASYS